MTIRKFIICALVAVALSFLGTLGLFTVFGQRADHNENPLIGAE